MSKNSRRKRNIKKKKTVVKKKTSAQIDTYHALGLCFIIVFVMFIIPFALALTVLKLSYNFEVSWIQIGCLSIILIMGIYFRFGY